MLAMQPDSMKRSNIYTRGSAVFTKFLTSIALAACFGLLFYITLNTRLMNNNIVCCKDATHSYTKDKQQPIFGGEWEQENERRKLRIQQVCSKHGLSRNPDVMETVHNRLMGQLIHTELRHDAKIMHNISEILGDRMIVEERHGLALCAVPKSGLTNWKRVLLRLSANLDVAVSSFEFQHPEIVHRSDKYIRRLGDFTEYGAQYRLKNYTKVLFARHPLERVLSAYRYAIENPWMIKFKSWSDYFAKHYLQKDELLGLTFADFVKCIIKDADMNRSPDVHWAPISKMCFPCDVTYDVIGTFDTLEEDSDYILKYIGVDWFHYPHSKTAGSTKRLMEQYYSTVSVNDIEKLWSLFKLDAELFGYARPAKWPGHKSGSQQFTKRSFR